MPSITYPKTYSTTLEALSCGSCGIPFAMPDDMHRKAKADGASFWCPNGCKISYHETDNQRLKRELREAKQARDRAAAARLAAEDQAQAAEYRRRAAVGQVTRIRNRVANGVCPCCKRTFANLARHMAGQHPGYAQEPTAGT